MKRSLHSPFIANVRCRVLCQECFVKYGGNLGKYTMYRLFQNARPSDATSLQTRTIYCSRCHPSQWLVYVPAKFNYNVTMFEYYPYFKRVWCTVTRGLLTTLRIGPLYPTQTLCPCPSLPGWTVEQLSSARVRTSDQLPSYLGRDYTLVDTVRFQYLTQKIFKP